MPDMSAYGPGPSLSEAMIEAEKSHLIFLQAMVNICLSSIIVQSCAVGGLWYLSLGGMSEISRSAKTTLQLQHRNFALAIVHTLTV